MRLMQAIRRDVEQLRRRQVWREVAVITSITPLEASVGDGDAFPILDGGHPTNLNDNVELLMGGDSPIVLHVRPPN
jgi:hypothetical protein